MEFDAAIKFLFLISVVLLAWCLGSALVTFCG